MTQESIRTALECQRLANLAAVHHNLPTFFLCEEIVRRPTLQRRGAEGARGRGGRPERGPRAMFAMVDNPAVAPVAIEAEERLRRVVDAVGGKEAV